MVCMRGVSPLGLAEETGLPVLVAESPLTCVVRGSGMALERMDKFGSVFSYD
jgi:rod shape-determining protein MreB